jgi:hypothetical protein
VWRSCLLALAGDVLEFDKQALKSDLIRGEVELSRVKVRAKILTGTPVALERGSISKLSIKMKVQRAPVGHQGDARGGRPHAVVKVSVRIGQLCCLLMDWNPGQSSWPPH